MSCIAQIVRDENALLWSPDQEGEAAPELLAGEPVTADAYETPDGRSWVRVYLDSSALDQNGTVYPRAPDAAATRKLESVFAEG